MELFLLSVIIIGFAIAGIGIKMFFKHGGTFTRKCGSSFDPITGKPAKCTCQNKTSEDCENKEDQNNDESKSNESV